MTRSTRRMQGSIGVQAIALAGSTGAAQAVMAVLYILSAKSVDPAAFGLVVTAIALGTSAVGLLDFGTNSYWVREIASNRLDTATLGKRLASKLLYSAVVLTAWTAITASLLPATNLWIAGPVALSMIASQSFQVPLRGLGRADLVALAVLADRAVAAAVFFPMLLTGTSPLSALWLSLTVGGIASALLCWSMTPRSNRPGLSLHLSTNPWSASVHYGLANVALSAQSLDIPTLTMVGGPSAAGVYAAVSRWTQPMGLLASAFSSASAPHVARAGTARQAWRSARKSVWLLLVAMGLCIVTAIYSDLIVDLLIGPNYSGSAEVLRILAFTTILSIANQPLFVFLQARGFDRPIALITVLSVGLQLLLVGLLSGALQALGAAIAAACTQLVLFVLMGSLLASKWNSLRTESSAIERESV